MNSNEKTNVELLKELQELKSKYNLLKIKYDQDKTTQKALRESEERYRLLADVTIEGILIHKDGIALDLNQALAIMLGYNKEELINTNLIDFIHEEDQHIAYENIAKNYNLPYEVRVIKKNGELFIAELLGKTIYGNDNELRVVGIRDITEKKKSAELLRKSEERYRSILNASPDDITIADLDGKILMVSPAAVKLFGFNDENEGIGHHVIKFIHPDDHEIVKNNISLRYQGIVTGPIEYRGLRKDGQVFHIEVNSEFVRNNENNPVEMVIIARDITDRKIAEEERARMVIELQRSNEIIAENLYQKNQLIEELSHAKDNLEKINSEKDKFFTIIAHDLKSPFAGFLGLTKMMAEDVTIFDAKEVQEISKDMQTSASNLYSLLENLLEWARIQRDLTAFNPERCILLLIVKQIIDVQTEVAKAKEITFVNEINEVETVNADVQMLNTIFRNLISNAIKFTPRGGNIEIGTTSDERNFRDGVNIGTTIYVKDSGIGMSSEIIRKLFKIEEKVSRPGTENEPSTGLGLLLCKEFVEKHGGKIWVESEEGIGSTFYFTLPF